MTKDNKYVQAMKENENILGLASAAALSVALLNPIPLIAGAVAEVAYLLTVPDSKWYSGRLDGRTRAAEVERRRKLRDSVYPQLSKRMQERLSHLEAMRAAIADQVKEEPDVFSEVLDKLDYLLEKFLVFGNKETQFRNYLGTMWTEALHSLPPTPRTNPRGRTFIPADTGDDATASIEEKIDDVCQCYQASIEKVQALADAEADISTKLVLSKRVDVLQQRKDFAGRIGKILTNLTYQLALVEDTFGLINDQIRARSPEQVLADIDSVVYQTDSMTRLLEEMGPYDEITR